MTSWASEAKIRPSTIKREPYTASRGIPLMMLVPHTLPHPGQLAVSMNANHSKSRIIWELKKKQHKEKRERQREKQK